MTVAGTVRLLQKTYKTVKENPGRTMQSAVRQVRTVVIDDSPAFLRSLCTLLQKQELAQVVGAGEGAEEALALVEQLHPELVLIDFQMTGMNGLAATSLLRRRYPDIKVVLVTMHDSPQLREASRESGAHGFVAKAHIARELPGVLSEVLAQGKAEE